MRIVTFIAFLAALSFAPAALAQTPAPSAIPRSPDSTRAFDPAAGIAATYGTSNLANPPNAVLQFDPATQTNVLSLQPSDILAAQNRRTQPPITLQGYTEYGRRNELLMKLDALRGQPNLDPTLPILLAWNHVALDMTSIDHTTAGNKIMVAGYPDPLPVFEPTYAEQFGPPRASRAMAILHLAMFEAANTVDSRYRSYQPAGSATDIQQRILQSLGGGAKPTTDTASQAAAISEAAYGALVSLYPRKKFLLDVNRLQIGILVSAQEQARGGADAAAVMARLEFGRRVGQAAAAVIVAERAGDQADFSDPTNVCSPKPGQPPRPPETLVPKPLCDEAYFEGNVPKPADPLAWTIDPILPTPVKLGANWKLVTPFVLTKGQFISPAGLAPGPGPAIPLPKATDPRFIASIDNGAYGPKISDPHGTSTQVFSKYGVRRYGGFEVEPGTPIFSPPGQGLRVSTETDRTPEQTVYAQFWGYDATALLCAPPRLYNMIATSFYLDRLNTTTFDPHAAVRAARYLALVNFALADAGIAAWNAKFTYNVARPITYIRDHGPDPKHPKDFQWTLLGQVASNGTAPNTTPPFPAYPSGHAVFGAAVFDTMKKALKLEAAGANTAFNFLSDEYNGLTYGSDGNLRPPRPLYFRSLDAAKWENAESRIWLGVHWQFDGDDGILLGEAVAKTVHDQVMQELP
jgi:hypothetical protein